MMTPPPPPRRCPRYRAYLDAAVAYGDSRERGTVLSLSDKGLFIATPASVPPGTTLRLRIRVPDLGMIELLALVIYRAMLQDHAGLGLRFFSPAAAVPAVEAVKRWHEEYMRT